MAWGTRESQRAGLRAVMRSAPPEVEPVPSLSLRDSVCWEPGGTHTGKRTRHTGQESEGIQMMRKEVMMMMATAIYPTCNSVRSVLSSLVSRVLI